MPSGAYISEPHEDESHKTEQNQIIATTESFWLNDKNPTKSKPIWNVHILWTR